MNTKPTHPELCCIGELLVDFESVAEGENAFPLGDTFRRCAGGAVANVAVGAQRLGVSTGLIACVGNDPFGRFLIDSINREGVTTRAIEKSHTAKTTLAIVSNDSDGERSFSFYRNPGADTQLRLRQLGADMIRNAKILHFGSLSLTHEPAKSATLAAIELARVSGVTVSFDPNYRSSLWANPTIARRRILSVLPKVDILKLSDSEAKLLTGHSDTIKAANQLRRLGPKLVIVTLGENGCIYTTDTVFANVPSIRSKAVDTTGAGDSFWAAILSCVLETGLDEIDLERACAFANAAAAITVQGKGAIPSLPHRAQVERQLSDSEKQPLGACSLR